jgi:hypothetical protein
VSIIKPAPEAGEPPALVSLGSGLVSLEEESDGLDSVAAGGRVAAGAASGWPFWAEHASNRRAVVAELTPATTAARMIERKARFLDLAILTFDGA